MKILIYITLGNEAMISAEDVRVACNKALEKFCDAQNDSYNPIEESNDIPELYIRDANGNRVGSLRVVED